ncbi:MAG: IPT/TIG domain-containing protein, partial [Desulfuromonadaceae bacterium]
MGIRYWLLGIWLVFGVPFAVSAMEIVAISPSTATVGTRVNVGGGPFPAEITVLVGERPVHPELVTERQLVFVVPPLPAGEYLLTVKSGEQVLPPPFELKIVDPKPVILDLDPPRIDLCGSGEERRIQVMGKDFAPGARLLLDGAQLPSAQVSSERFDLLLPALEPGLHPLEIVNPDGSRSLPFAVLIEGVPEIFSVVPGDDRVVSYDLVIHGRNFSSSSDLLVNGVSVGRSLPVSGKRGGGRDRLVFVDCQTLVYTRFPLSREPMPLALVVVAPGVQRSPPFHITAP